MADYRRSLPLAPRDARTENDLAWMLVAHAETTAEQTAQALVWAKNAVELAPMEGTYWNTLGAAHYRAGEFPAAIQALEKSMELAKGGNSFDWFFLAMAHWQLGHSDNARKWLAKAIEWMQKHRPKDDELRRFLCRGGGVD